MKKLLPLAIGATLTVLTASPVWADREARWLVGSAPTPLG